MKKIHNINILRYLAATSPMVFIKQLIHAPGTTGAVLPSFSSLANHMVKHIPQEKTGLVIELGAGTGSITKAILRSAIDRKRLIVIELSENFLGYLRKKFPSVNVQQGNARDLSDIIPKNNVVDVILSGLPLKSLQKKDVVAILQEWRRLLTPDGIIVQFTYDLKTPHPTMFKNFDIIQSERIWMNIPPARILVLKPKV